MAILYKIRSQKIPLEEKTVYYGQHVNMSNITLDTIAEDIAKRAGQSKGTVVGLLEDLFEEMLTWILAGYSVSFNEIGSFHVSISTFGADTKDAFDIRERFRRAIIRVTPSTAFKKKVALTNPDIHLKKVDDLFK